MQNNKEAERGEGIPRRTVLKLGTAAALAGITYDLGVGREAEKVITIADLQETIDKYLPQGHGKTLKVFVDDHVISKPEIGRAHV